MYSARRRIAEARYLGFGGARALFPVQSLVDGELVVGAEPLLERLQVLLLRIALRKSRFTQDGSLRVGAT